MDSAKFSLYQRLNIIGIAVGVLYFALRYGALPSYNSPEYSSASTRESPARQPNTAKPIASSQDNVAVSTPVDNAIVIDIADINPSGYMVKSGSNLRIQISANPSEVILLNFGKFSFTDKHPYNWPRSRGTFLRVPVTATNNTAGTIRVGFEIYGDSVTNGFVYTEVKPKKRRKETPYFDVFRNEKVYDIVLVLRINNSSSKRILIPLKHRKHS